MEFPKLATGGDGGTGETDGSEKKSLLDKLTNLGPAAQKAEQPIDYSKLENVKTKSMVESKRESASQELQQIQALEEQRLAQLKMQENVAAAKKTGVYVTVTVICGILLICLVFFFVALVKYLREPTDITINTKPNSSEATTIGNYSCKNSGCEKLYELKDGRQLIKDEGYLLFDQESKESFILALEGENSEFVDFTWGDKQYLFVKNSDGLSAIFLLTENRYITEALYEDILSDSSDAAYAKMEWVIGNYIIAKRSNSYRLVNIEDGTEKVSGALGVFATKSGYYLAKEENNVRRVFNSSKTQILLTDSETKLYERDGFLVKLNNNTVEIIKNDGNTARSEDCPFYDELSGSDKDEIQNRLNGGAYLLIP